MWYNKGTKDSDGKSQLVERKHQVRQENEVHINFPMCGFESHPSPSLLAKKKLKKTIDKYRKCGIIKV